VDEPKKIKILTDEAAFFRVKIENEMIGIEPRYVYLASESCLLPLSMALEIVSNNINEGETIAAIKFVGMGIIVAEPEDDEWNIWIGNTLQSRHFEITK
jgi:hypothetical protein